jgi:prepilin-type N-terminal cleavage/methylation domain-containing protein
MSIGKNPLRLADCGLRIRRGRSAESAAQGFTLTELLLVMSIIVLLGGLGGGVYVGTYKRLLVEKAARQFFLTARYARIVAVEQQRPYELQLLSGEKTGFLLTTTQVSADTGQTEKIIVRDLCCRPVDFEGDVQFEDIRIVTMNNEQASDTDQECKIIFLPNGSSESAVVQIGDGKTHYTIAVVAASGKATLYEGTADTVKMVMIDLDEPQEGNRRATSGL